jgi:hypothetical protein
MELTISHTQTIRKSAKEGQQMNNRLDPGTVFPELSLNITGGESIQFPSTSDTPFTIALFYRGHW